MYIYICTMSQSTQLYKQQRLERHVSTYTVIISLVKTYAILLQGCCAHLGSQMAYISVSFDFITTWNQGVFLWSPCISAGCDKPYWSDKMCMLYVHCMFCAVFVLNLEWSGCTKYRCVKTVTRLVLERLHYDWRRFTTLETLARVLKVICTSIIVGNTSLQRGTACSCNTRVRAVSARTLGNNRKNHKVDDRNCPSAAKQLVYTSKI
jgi:hypothetical protein